MIKIQIKTIFGKILFEYEKEKNTIRETLQKAVEAKAYLRGAYLRGAYLSGVPVIENIHQKIFAAATKTPESLDMSSWHTCDTTHCRAGWAVVLAGEKGTALENKVGTGQAAALIYLASDPGIEKIPAWNASDEEALEDMKKLAELESTNSQ